MSTTSRGWEMYGVPQPHMEALWGFRGGRMGGGEGYVEKKTDANDCVCPNIPVPGRVTVQCREIDGTLCEGGVMGTRSDE